MSKILELCLSPDLGGLELYMYNSAESLSQTQNVLSIINPKGKLAHYFKKSTLEVEYIDKRSKLMLPFSAKKLAYSVDRHAIDIIHIHWTKDLPLAVLAKLFAQREVKLVQSRHMHMTRFKDDFYHRFLYKHINLMLAVTAQVKGQMETFIPQSICPNVEVLYLGSKEAEVLDSDTRVQVQHEFLMQDRFVVGMVGRINVPKGQHLLIEAIALIADEKVHAYFAGQEMKVGYIDTLKQLAKDLGVEHRVHFLGFLDKPEVFFQVCDTIVLASKKETFGLVLIEAMQVNTPVIGSNSGGVVEIIDDEESGLLFDAGDAGSLAEKITRVKNDTTLGEALASKAKLKAEKMFAYDKHFIALEKILKELV